MLHCSMSGSITVGPSQKPELTAREQEPGYSTRLWLQTATRQAGVITSLTRTMGWWWWQSGDHGKVISHIWSHFRKPSEKIRAAGTGLSTGTLWCSSGADWGPKLKWSSRSTGQEVHRWRVQVRLVRALGAPTGLNDPDLSTKQG